MSIDSMKEVCVAVVFALLLLAFSPGLGFAIVLLLIAVLGIGIIAAVFYPLIREMFPTLHKIK